MPERGEGAPRPSTMPSAIGPNRPDRVEVVPEPIRLLEAGDVTSAVGQVLMNYEDRQHSNERDRLAHSAELSARAARHVRPPEARR